MASGEFPVMLRWLMILGWQIEVECAAGVWVGTARHSSDDGRELTVGGCGSSYGELAWQLFSGAVDALELGRSRLEPLAA